MAHPRKNDPRPEVAFPLDTFESEYPLPIARCIRRFRVTDADDVAARHDHLADVFEVVLKTVAVIALQDVRAHGHVTPQVEQAVQSMIQPALGHWGTLLRTACREADQETRAAHFLRQWLTSTLPADVRDACRVLRPGVTPAQREVTTINELVDLLITYRNKVWRGHGARLTSTEYAERLPPLIRIFDHFLRTMSLLSDLELVYVDEVQVLPNGEFRHKVKTARGQHVEPQYVSQDRALLPQRLYVRGRTFDTTGPVGVSPLLTLAVCKQCRSEQVFIFNDIRRGHLEFLSYGCGHLAFPDLLSSEIAHLLDVTIAHSAGGTAEIVDRESVHRAASLRLSASEAIARQQYDGAARLLRESLALEPDDAAAVLAALCLLAAGERLVQARALLETALEKNPRNEAAAGLVERLSSISQTINEPPTDLQAIRSLAENWLAKLVYYPRVATIFDAILPSRLRSRWLVTSMLVLAPSTILLNLFYSDNPLSVPLVISRLAILIGVLLTFRFLHDAARALFFVLGRQVETTPGFDFGRWYQQQLVSIFGVFRGEGALCQRLGLDTPEGRSYLALAGALFLTATGGVMILQCGYAPSAACAGSAAIPSVVPFLFGSLLAPAVSRMFRMLREYSRLNLRPLVGKSGALSYQEPGDATLKVTLCAFLAFGGTTALGYLSFSRSVVALQLALWGLLLLLGTLWTAGVPVSLWLALRSSRSRHAARFNQHLRESLEELVRSPSAECSERVTRLQEQEKLLRAIRSWPMSAGVTLALVALNLMILAIAVMYPILKFGWRPLG